MTRLTVIQILRLSPICPTGMGQDGAFGMKMIKKRGGYTVAQDETTSVVYGMAKAAKELESVDKMLPINEISDEIVRLVNA